MAILSFLKNLLQLVLAPSNGWEEVSHDGAEPERLAADGLYPLMGLAAATVFIQGCYDKIYDVTSLLQRAMVVFMSLFISYWAGAALMDNYINRFTDTDISSKLTRTVTIYIISLLAVIQVIENLVPVEFTVIRFLPAFAAIVLWKATAYLSIRKADEGLYIIFALGVLIIPWMLINTLLSLLL